MAASISTPATPDAGAAELAAQRMDAMYRYQRHIYDLTRKFYLFGRDQLLSALPAPPGAAVLEMGCGTGASNGKLWWLPRSSPRSSFNPPFRPSERSRSSIPVWFRTSTVRLRILRSHWPSVYNIPGSFFGPTAISATTQITSSSPNENPNTRENVAHRSKSSNAKLRQFEVGEPTGLIWHASQMLGCGRARPMASGLSGHRAHGVRRNR